LGLWDVGCESGREGRREEKAGSRRKRGVAWESASISADNV
jgi:hypothetical protein